MKELVRESIFWMPTSSHMIASTLSGSSVRSPSIAAPKSQVKRSDGHRTNPGARMCGLSNIGSSDLTFIQFKKRPSQGRVYNG